MSEPTKYCKECDTTKPHSDYYAHKKTADGLQPICKTCHLKKQREYQDNRKKLDKAKEDGISNTSRSSPQYAYAKAVYQMLHSEKMFKSTVRKLSTIDLIAKAINTVVNLNLDESLDDEGVMDYTQADLRKDLIKMVKSSNAQAAEKLIKFNNWESKSDEIIIVPLEFGEDCDITSEALLSRYVANRDK